MFWDMVVQSGERAALENVILGSVGDEEEEEKEGEQEGEEVGESSERGIK